jgi:hypothetical protein
MTVYLIDANVLIRAHGDYYPIDRIKPFWGWLLAEAESGRVKMPYEVYDEVAKSPDLLGQWLQQPQVRKAIVLPEPTEQKKLAYVINQGYAPDLDDVEIEKIGRDPFLIAPALHKPDRVVVTREVSRPMKQRANRKVPDVCASVGVQCTNDFELWRRLDFRIE